MPEEKLTLNKSAPVTEKKPVQLASGNIQLAQHARNVFRVRVNAEVTNEDMIQPMFWANEANQLAVGSIVEVIAHDHSWFAEYYIMSKGNDWAKLALMRWVVLEAKTASIIPKGYIVEYVNDELKWCATRSADQRRVISGQPSRESAIVWLDNHLKKVA